MTARPLFNRHDLQWLLALVIVGYGGWTFAETSAQTPSKAPPALAITALQGQKLQLDVQQMRLPQILDSLADKTHIPIHHSNLPEDVVTANCSGTTFKEVLECLLDQKAGLIVRYPNKQNQTTRKFQMAEVWIMGSRLNGTDAEDSPAATANSSRQGRNNEAGRIDQLLEMAESQNPQERADAIGKLIDESHTSNLAITSTLEHALSDEDASVRAQAISSYAHHENSEAVTQAIREAMNDSSADVRMMAVDSITNDAELLQQAAHDSDETIRSLAAMKLKALVSSKNAK